MDYLAKSYPVKSGMAYKVPLYRVKLTSTARPGEEKWTCALRFLPVKNNINDIPFMSGLMDAQSYFEPTYDPIYTPHNTQGLDIGGFSLYDNFLVHAGPDSVTDYGVGGKGCVEVVSFDQFKLDIVHMCGKHPSDLPDKTMAYLCGKKRLHIVIEAANKPPVIEIMPPIEIMDNF